jgi:hypothetical protein
MQNQVSHGKGRLCRPDGIIGAVVTVIGYNCSRSLYRAAGRVKAEPARLPVIGVTPPFIQALLDETQALRYFFIAKHGQLLRNFTSPYHRRENEKQVADDSDKDCFDYQRSISLFE